MPVTMQVCKKEDQWEERWGGVQGGGLERNKSVGSWSELHWAWREISAVPGISINLWCDLWASPFTCWATFVAPSLPLSPLVCSDHKFLGTGTASLCMPAPCLAQRDFSDHSYINVIHMKSRYYSEPMQFQSWKHLLPHWQLSGIASQIPFHKVSYKRREVWTFHSSILK